MGPVTTLAGLCVVQAARTQILPGLGVGAANHFAAHPLQPGHGSAIVLHSVLGDGF